MRLCKFIVANKKLGKLWFHGDLRTLTNRRQILMEQIIPFRCTSTSFLIVTDTRLSDSFVRFQQRFSYPGYVTILFLDLTNTCRAKCSRCKLSEYWFIINSSLLKFLYSTLIINQSSQSLHRDPNIFYIQSFMSTIAEFNLTFALIY